MKQTPKEYAELLIYRYGFTEFALNCAIIDVKNTMEALNEQYIEIWGKSKDWKYTEHNTYFKNVLQILKDRI